MNRFTDIELFSIASFFLSSYITTRLLLQRKRIFARPIHPSFPSPIQGEATNSFHSIKYTIIPNRNHFREEGPFQGATKWGEKRCAHLGLREREGEENRVNGIRGPRSGSSTLPRVVVKAISAGERAFECSGAKRDREREEGVEKKQIDTSAAPSSRPVLS